MSRYFNTLAIVVFMIALFSGCSRSNSAPPVFVDTDPIAWGTYGGAFGNGNGEFHNPGEIAFGSDGKIYVADVFNGRVQVFDENLTYLRQWDVEGFFQHLALDGDDYVYIPIWSGYVIKFDTMGNEILRWGERGDSPGEFMNPSLIAIDQNENRVYVGDGNNQNIQVFNCSGQFLERWERLSPNGITVDNDGNIFLTARGVILKRSMSGEPLERWELFDESCSGAIDPYGIAIDSEGFIFVSDIGTNQIHKLDQSGVPLLCWGRLGSDEGEFCRPSNIAIADDNSLFISDFYNNHRIQRFNSAGEYIQEIGKTPPSCEYFIWPQYLAIGPDSAVYVSDINYVKKYDIDGTFISCWGGLGNSEGQFNGAQGIAVHEGRVFVVDRGNYRVQIFDESGGILGEWGSRGYAEGEFDHPNGIMVDEGGTVLVLDAGNSRVQLFESSGVFLSEFGVAPRCHGLTVDNQGGIYVTTRADHTVTKYDYDGNVLLEWGGEGVGSGEFDGPTGIAIDPEGFVYVVDFENSRVHKFDGSGTFIANWGTSGSDLGELYRPQGVACVGDFVIIADSNNHRVQRFHPSYWALVNEILEK